MAIVKNRAPKLSAFAQMLRDKREKLAPDATLREFCAARGLESAVIDEMEHDRRTAPGTYGGLYKLAGGYGHKPDDRWTRALLDAALGKIPVRPRPVAATRRGVGRASEPPKRDARSNGTRSAAADRPAKARTRRVTRGR